MAIDAANGIRRSAVSNTSGLFVLPDLPIGRYTLEVSAQGFETQKRPELSLLSGQVIDLSIQLSVGSETRVVTVSSEAQSIETSTSTVTNLSAWLKAEGVALCGQDQSLRATGR